MKYKIYQVYRTNGNTNRYEYIGSNIENAKAAFILYYLYSSDRIRIDHKNWKLAYCEIEDILLNKHEYFTIDSLEMNLLKKNNPDYISLIQSIPWEIDEITNKDNIYDDYLAFINQHESYIVDITNNQNLTIEELIASFDEAYAYMSKRLQNE